MLSTIISNGNNLMPQIHKVTFCKISDTAGHVKIIATFCDAIL